MEESDLIFRLVHCRGIGRTAMRRLMAYHSLMATPFEQTSPSELTHLLNLPVNQMKAFLDDWCRFNASTQSDIYRQKTISFTTYFDPDFPPLLKEIPDPPLLLFYKGDLTLAREKKSLSVVGTRHPTKEGLQAMSHVLSPLIEEGWQIVSGLALGVDGAAHKLALRSKTIAVLGSGLDHLYPKAHLGLAQTLSETHLILSEYPPYSTPQKWMFPERNRLISGLSMGTLVVEAKERSGSLITADQALEQGREVFAIPGSIFNPMAKGTNRLIKQGATCVTKADDLRDALTHYL